MVSRAGEGICDGSSPTRVTRLTSTFRRALSPQGRPAQPAAGPAPQLSPNDHPDPVRSAQIYQRVLRQFRLRCHSQVRYPLRPRTRCGDGQQARTDLPPEPRLNLPAPDIADAAAVGALLAERNRAAIMRMLADGPMCVCDTAAALGEKQNNVSMHLARLRDAGLVRAVRHPGDARWMFYERDTERCSTAADLIGGLLR